MIARRNNHFVWQHYLKRWSENGRDVFYISPLGKVSNDSVKGLAMKKDFYRCQSLSPNQLEIIRLTSLNADPDIQKHHTMILDSYMQIQRREKKLQTLGIKNTEAEKILEAMNSNFLEDLHTLNENLAKPILTRLAEGDVTPLQNGQNLCNFLMFLGHQITRTRAFKETCLAAIPSAVSWGESYRKELEGCWWFYSYMKGVNMGWGMFKQRAEMNFCLLMAPAGTNFITSDQPVINVHEALRDDEMKPPEKVDFYYPLSPKIAFMANESERFPCGLSNVDRPFVQSMNEKMSKKAEKMICGLTSEDIEPFRRNVGVSLKDIRQRFSGKAVQE